MKPAILSLRGVLISALSEELTDQDIVQFQGDVLSAVERARARAVVLDISALDVLDTYMARALRDTADMSRLLGACVVVCGMRPTVALTLVEMGQELVGIRTALDLDGAIDAIEADTDSQPYAAEAEGA